MSLTQAIWQITVLDLAMIAFTLALLTRAGLSRSSRTKLAAIGVGWLLLLRLMFGASQPFSTSIGGLGFFAVVLLGVAVVGAVMLIPTAQRRFMTGIPQPVLLAAQGIRVAFGATFLFWAGQGLLPTRFGIIDGYTHITAGFLGLLAALSATWSPDRTGLIWMANLFGLGDILIVASSISFVLLPDISPYHPIMYAVFLPAPVWLWFHVVSIGGLVSKRVNPPERHLPHESQMSNESQMSSETRANQIGARA